MLGKNMWTIPIFSPINQLLFFPYLFNYYELQCIIFANNRLHFVHLADFIRNNTFLAIRDTLATED